MKRISLVLMAIFTMLACDPEYNPKPKGYFRISTPAADYQAFEEDCPYSFDFNKSANLELKGPCWYDIKYPNLKATLQLTYKAVKDDNLDTLLADGHRLAYKHTVKADGIDEKLYLNEDKQVYGLLYQLKGDAATNLQFFMTDSTNHFLRGVLYYYASPNADSLKPVNDFMRGEMIHLIETLKWENS